MIDVLGIITLIGLILIQFLLGCLAASRSASIHRNKNYQILSGQSLIDMLTAYIRIFGSINVKVDAPISKPALFVADTLFIKKSYAHSSSLYAMFWALWQIVGGQLENRYWLRSRVYQNLGWYVQFLLLVLALNNSEWLLIGLPWALICLGYAFWLYIISEQVMVELLDTLFVLVDLSNLERKMLVKWAKNLRADVFAYPCDLPIFLVKFLLPRWGSGP